MKKFFYVLSILLLFLPCTMAQSNKPFTSAQVITWAKGESSCDEIFVNGHPFKVIDRDGVQVSVTLYDTGWKMRADVYVSNKTEDRFDLLPDQITLDVVKPKQKSLKYQSQEQLEKSLNRKVGWANVFASMGTLARKQSTATATDQNGNAVQVRTDEPDYEAQRRSRDQIEQNREKADDALSYMRRIILLPNTIMPGKQIIGAVFFEREKKIDVAVIRIPIADKVFEFPFYSDKGSKEK